MEYEKQETQVSQEEIKGKQSETSTEENINPIEKAQELAKRIEAANAKQEELLNRQEELAARDMLSGRASAGISQKKIPKTDEQITEDFEAGKIDLLAE